MISGIVILAFASMGTVLVVLLWRRIFAEAEIPPEVRVPGAAAVDTQECRLAVHEAGHAVAAWCCTLVSDVTVVTIEAKAKDLGAGLESGLVNYSYYAIDWADGRWCKLVIALSGVCAEAMVYSRWRTTGSERDLAQALQMAESLADGSSPPWQRLGVTSGAVPNLARAFKVKPTAAVAENLEEGYRMARRVLRSHGGAFFKVVSALLAKKSTSRADLEAALGGRYYAKLALAGAQIESVINQSGKAERFKPRFVLPGRRKKAA